MSKKTVNLSLKVQAPEDMAPEQVAKLVETLIDIGLADAAATLEDSRNSDEGDVEAAQQSLDMDISAPVVATPPRVLVVVSGGVADPVFDAGVDVEVFDWDNYKADPEGTGPAPAHFKDLADPLDVPVALAQAALPKTITMVNPQRMQPQVLTGTTEGISPDLPGFLNVSVNQRNQRMR